MVDTAAPRIDALGDLRKRVRHVGPLVGLSLVLLLIIWLAINFAKDPAIFTKAFLIGVTNGSVYALVALGYTLVYGILELINFAHGDVFMLGGMMSATMMVSVFNIGSGESAGTLWPAVFASLAVAMIFCGLLNASIERVAYRRLRNAPRLAPLITAIAMSFILQNVGIVWKGPNFVSLPVGILPHGTIFTIGKNAYHWDDFTVVLLTVPVLLVLIWLVQYTKQGKAMRATAQDREAAAMMGIDVNRTISFTFLIAGALAGSAGLIYAVYFTSIRFDQGFQLGLFAFTAAVLGGIGNLPGAVLGALFIGLVQSFNNTLPWHAPGSDWTQSIVFSILILVLVFRPEGILGERTPEGG